MSKNIRTWAVYLLLACAFLIFLGLWIFTGHLAPLAFFAISIAAFLVRRGDRRQR